MTEEAADKPEMGQAEQAAAPPGAEGPAPDASAGPMAASEQTFAELAAERDRYLEIAKRARADFENYQTRVRRDMESERKYAGLPLVRDLLPVIDNLSRALDAAKGQTDLTQFLQGVDMVRRQSLDVLAKHQIVPIEPQNEPFDPHQHEAVMQQPSNEHPPMTVLMTVETGFKLHDRVVRPAKVIVAAAPA